MKTINHQAARESRPVSVIQFGEGNFLRGFVDWMLEHANRKGVTDAGVAIVKPIPFGSLDDMRAQDCLYTVLLRGRQGGETVDSREVVGSVVQAVDCYGEYDRYAALARLDTLRFVVSNTTEAGIIFDDGDRLELCPPNTYPGKLTKLLYNRFTSFGGSLDKGLIVLPVELIEHNGAKLLDCVQKLITLWKLPEDFRAWVNNACLFCDTLVDRIVPGYPKTEAERLWAELGYEDRLMVAGEPFALWVIQSDRYREVQKALPLDEAGLPVVFTDNLKPYRERKVRILNGAHTGAILGAYLAGLDTVGECMNNPVVRPYLEKMIYSEIAPTVKLPEDEVKAFADSVMERFENPFIRHELLSIALNSVSKWKTRILPSLLDSHAQNGKLPPLLTFSFAALLAFYRTGERGDKCLVGRRGDDSYNIMDDGAVMDFFSENAARPVPEYVLAAAGNIALWGQDLTLLDGFSERVTADFKLILSAGALEAMREATTR